MTNFVIYARESSDDNSKAPSIENQIERGKAWGIQEGYTLTDIYEDNGWSGGDNTRPDWNRLLNDAPNKAIDFVWVFDGDRIARQVGDFRTFYERITKCNIRIMTGTAGEITMNDTGQFANWTFQSASAEFLRRITSDKVRATYKAKKKAAEQKGEFLKWGKNPIPIEHIRAAKEMKKQHPELSVRSIAEALPTYKLKLREIDNGIQRERKVSPAWVAKILKTTDNDVEL